MNKSNGSGAFNLWRAVSISALAAAMVPTQAAGASQRPWTTADSAEVIYVPFEPEWETTQFRSMMNILPSKWAETPDLGTIAPVPAPDGRHFFVLHRHGDLQANQTIWTLAVYDRDRAVALVKGNGASEVAVAQARHVGRFIDGAALRSPKWDSDSKGVLFLGSTDQGMQLFRLDVTSGSTVQLTRDTGGVGDFDGGAGSIFYSSYKEGKLWDTPKIRYPMAFGVRDPETGEAGSNISESGVSSQFAIIAGNPPLKLDRGIDLHRNNISPDGRMSATWNTYPSEDKRLMLLRLEAGSEPKEVASVLPVDDLVIPKNDGEAASVATPNKLLKRRTFWSADSQHVIVVGVQRPGTSKSEGIRSFGIYHVADGSWEWGESVPTGAKIRDIQWSQTRGELLMTWQGGRRSGYRLVEGKLSPVENAVALSESFARPLGNLHVWIREDHNHPPTVMGRVGDRERPLSKPDPVLKAVAHIPVRPFHWIDPDGKPMEGGLVLPRDYRPGKKVPVVVNPYWYIPQRWLPDGVNVSSDAAQAMAARGIAVLLVDLPNTDNEKRDASGRSMPAEGSKFVGRLDAIVDALVTQGFATADRIGLNGFSRGGYNSLYASTHPARTAIAATMANDNYRGDMQMYLLQAAGSGGPEVADSGFASSGRDPWRDPLYWLDQDPIFNVDRVRGPMLFSYINFVNGWIPEKMSFLGAYRLNAKPMETIDLANDAHSVRMPMARAALHSAAVDWFAFWLMGEEDPDPAKFQQYKRWRTMRADWKAEQAKEIAKGEPGFLKTRSGTMYKITDRRSGAAPNPGDSVTIRFKEYAPDGKVVVIGPATVEFSEMADPRLADAPGVTLSMGTGNPVNEALAVMHPGEKAIVLKGYAKGTKVQRWEVELLGITPKASTSVSHEPS